MVTTARATPSADGAAPPTIACAGTVSGNVTLAIKQGNILIGAAITQHAHAAKRRADWPCRAFRVSRWRNAFLSGRKQMIEAVIWDFGGVLTTSPFEAFARFETERGLPVDIIRRTNAANHLENAWAKFERAEVDIEAFDELFAAESLALGAAVRGKDVLPLLSGDLRPEMVEALKRVKAKFKTGCITNNLPANAIGSKSGRTLYVAEVMALFDHVIESAKIGLRKPDPRIYQLMVETLRVDPKNCVYLDDLGVNLKPAREIGMTTIKVVNAAQAITELEAATGLALR
jgi:putative hydrolase of the HAD superfamily